MRITRIHISDAYPKTVLRLHWSTKPEVQPIDRNMEIAMPDMELEDIVPGICNGTYATGNLIRSSDEIIRCAF